MTRHLPKARKTIGPVAGLLLRRILRQQEEHGWRLLHKGTAARSDGLASPTWPELG